MPKKYLNSHSTTMSYQNLKVLMYDTASLPIQGHLTLEPPAVLFKSIHGEEQEVVEQFKSDEVKYISFQRVGYRGEEGPFFEITFYLKETGRVYTFGNFLTTMLEELTSYIKEHYNIQAEEKTIQPGGWNWGQLFIDHRYVCLKQIQDDDLESDESEENPEEQQEQSEVSEPLDAEILHFPTQLINDFQQLNNKDLIIEFQPSTIKNAVYVKQVTFNFSEATERDNAYSLLSRNVQKTSTERILMLEGITAFNPSSNRSNLEFGTDYIKLISSKEQKRSTKDITRVFFLEKNTEKFYAVLEFAHNAKNNDVIVLELLTKRENKELILPNDEESGDKLVRLLQIEDYASTYMNITENQNEPYGQNSLIQQIKQNEKSNIVRLRSVPQFIIVYKLLQFLCQNAKIIISGYVQHLYKNQPFVYNDKQFNNQVDDDYYCNITCKSAKNMNRDYQISIVDKFIVQLPNECSKIHFNEIAYIKIERDNKNSLNVQQYAKITIEQKSRGKIEYVKVDPDEAQLLLKYFKQQEIRTIDNYQEMGGRKDTNELQKDDEADDEEWNESDETEKGEDGYEFEEESVTSEKSDGSTHPHEVKNSKIKEQKQEVTKKDKKQRKTILDEYDGLQELNVIKPEHALLDVAFPSQWPGFKLFVDKNAKSKDQNEDGQESDNE